MNRGDPNLRRSGRLHSLWKLEVRLYRLRCHVGDEKGHDAVMCLGEWNIIIGSATYTAGSKAGGVVKGT